MAVSIGPVIGIKGEKEFRATLKEIIAETKKYSAEMDKLSDSFTKNDSVLSKVTRTHEQLKKEIEAQNRVVEQTTKLRDEAAKKYERDQQLLEKQREKVEQLNKQVEVSEKKVEALKTAYGDSHPYVQGATAALEKQKQELKEASEELDAMNVGIHRSGEVMQEWETKTVQATAKLDELNRQFKDTSLGKAWGQQFEDTGKKMADFGENLTKYVTAPLAALGGASIKAASDFQEGMAKIYTIAIDSAEPMEKMHDDLIRLSNDTGFSLDDLSEATYQAVSASVDATKAVEFMGDAAKLARAGFTTTTKSVDLLTTILNAYNYKVEDTVWISDMLLKTQNDGKTILDEMASSMGIIIPMASNYNVGLDQITAAYATMTKQGVKTERATTFLRAVFTELEKESSDVADILKDKTGKSFAQLMGEGKSLSDVLRILYKHAGNNTEEFQRLFGNVRATQAVASLVNDDFRLFDYELGRVRDSAGQVDKALEVMETPALKAKRAVNQLKNASVDVGESLIEQFTPAFEKAVDAIRKGTDAYVGLSDETKNLITNTALLVAGIGPAMTIGGKALELVGKLMLGLVPMSTIVATLGGAYLVAGAAAQAMTEAHINEIKAEWGLNQELQAGIQTVQDLNTQREELLISTKEETDATLGQIAVAQELITQYNDLIDSDGKVKEGKEDLAGVILNQLATALGMEYDDVLKLIEENGMFGQSIDETIAKIKQRAEMAAYEKLYQDAIERKIQAEAILEKQEDALTEAVTKSKTAHENTTKAYNDMIEAQRNGSQDIGYYEQKWRDAVQAESEAKNAEDTLRGAVTETKDTIAQASGDVTIYGNKMSQSAKDTAQSAEESGEKVKAKAKDTKETVGKYSKETADTVEKESKRAKVEADVNSKKAAEAVEHNMKLAGSDQIGYYLMSGIANGIAKYQYLAERAAANAGHATTRALNNSVQVKSPSRVTFETGKYFVEGFANAIDAGIGEMADMGYALGKATAHGLSVGSYIPETGNVYNNKTVSAPISVNVTVNGSVDDPQKFAREIGDMLANQLNRESEVFA